MFTAKRKQTVQPVNQDLPAPFSVTRADEPPVSVFVVHGELDIATASQLETALGRAPSTEPVVVDLCETTFMDSSGLRVLLRARAERGDELHVACSPAGPVQRTFDIAADGVLVVHANRTQAISAARERVIA